MTLRQENLLMFQDSNREIGYDDTVRPEKKVSLKSLQSSIIETSSATIRQADVQRQQAPQKHSAPYYEDQNQHFGSNENEDEWKLFFNSLAPDSLQQLYDMVERNEAKEINSIRNEFGPKLAPILEGIAYKRQQYQSIQQ